VPLVYDFWGFPERYYQVKYPALGAPALAEDVRKLLRAAGMPVAQLPDRGLDPRCPQRDHGVAVAEHDLPRRGIRWLRIGLTFHHGVDRRQGMTNPGVPGSKIPVPGGQRTALRGKWSITEGDARSIVAEARKAFFVMATVIAVLWTIQIFNWADHDQLTFTYGIRPRDVGSLPYIFIAPFLHFSWAHIEGNSGPLFIFGFLAAYRGVVKFLWVTVLVIVTSGLAAWLFEPANTVGAGASGVVFGYFGYIMVRGFFDRHVIDMIIGAIMALSFAYQFTVLLPHAGIGWQAHIGGLAGGVLAGWLFRDKRPGPSGKAGPAITAGRPVVGRTWPAADGTLPKPQAGLPKNPGAPGS
jgi:membrane associated rhomboid family serine protease